MRPLTKRNRLWRKFENQIKPPFLAVVTGSVKKSNRILYTVQGQGTNAREEIEVLVGAPITEWIAKGTEVLILPHLFSSAELFVIARTRTCALLGDLEAEGDFAIERSADTYLIFKTDEIVGGADKLTFEVVSEMSLKGDTASLEGTTTLNVKGDTANIEGTTTLNIKGNNATIEGTASLLLKGVSILLGLGATKFVALNGDETSTVQGHKHTIVSSAAVTKAK